MFRSKKRTIFTMFLVPLVVVMLVQAIVAYGTLWLGGTARHLDDYSVGIMEQIVRNRNLILENNMIHRWSDIEGECRTANLYLARILAERGLDEEQFLSDGEAKQELLRQMLLPGITMLRRNGVNGFYIVLADGQADDGVAEGEAGAGREEGIAGAGRHSGVYFRDSDASANPQDYSDLLMERGDFNFSHELNIPFDTVWTTKFNFLAEGQRADDNFYYKPYRAAMENPGSRASDLSYWSKLFCLEGNTEDDGYRMISYSRPLISEQGQVYGVLGIELSLTALASLLPESELNLGNQSGYVLAEYGEDGSLVPFYAKGAAVSRNLPLGVPLSLEKTKYDSLYEMNGIKENRKKFYADIVPFSMYNPNTPFEKNNWVLLGVQDQEALFGIGKRIIRNVVFVVLCSLVFGFICIYVLMNHLTKPISELAAWIRNVRRNTVKDYKKTNIAEIDDLYDAVYDLTERQKKAEYEAVEEKERYRLALQSSTDIIFTYNIREDSMDIFNLTTPNEDGQKELREPQILEKIRNSKQIHDMDRQMLEKVFICLDERFKIRFRFRSGEKGFNWLELSGKTICDDSGQKIKVIGSIRNINEQKMREQMESKSARLDPVTGLYREEIGQKIVNTEIEMGREGYLVLMDLDKFKEMNDRYGIEFGDAVLEEAGGYILKLKRRTEKSGKRIVAVRAGGDEILLWLRGFKRDETKEFLAHFYRMLGRLFQDGDFEISITAAGLHVTEGDVDYGELTGRLCAAMFCCKKHRAGRLTFYDELASSELSCESFGKRGYNDIASAGNTRNLNMVTRAFNLFERGGRVAPIVSVMFAKLGELYQMSDIVMTELRWDFNASAVSGQWHAQEETSADKTVSHFTEKELHACDLKLSSGSLCFGENDGLTEVERKVLHIPDGLFGLCVPLYDSGRLTGAVAFMKRPGQDVFQEQERGELQEIVKIIETNVNRERYDLASRAKSDFLSRMSHEIRTPMNAIIGMTAIAHEKKERPEEVENCLQKIDESSQYLLSLINDILDMSKIESGKMKLSFGAGDLNELGREVSDLMGPQMEEKHIHYAQDFRLKHGWVLADFMRLKQVIINLMGNAVKFTPQDGTITFSMVEREETGGETEVYFAVADTGIGIGRENRERIFSAFEQAESSTALSYGGTGLGLSISSRLVRMMGGDISLESEEGKGSRFSFLLRFREEKEQIKEEKESRNRKMYDFSGCRVLLVEDNELNTEIAKTLLEMNGFLVETAEDGLEGVKAFENSALYYYDLILMDIRMPVMDGLEAAETIRRMNREDASLVPIIAMTANAFDDDMKKSIESGMNGHLAKPVNVEELLRVAAEVIEKNKKIKKQ